MSGPLVLDTATGEWREATELEQLDRPERAESLLS